LADSNPSVVVPLVSIASQIETHLEQLILTGKLAGGARLSEPELAKWFRTSRAPVREALRRLQQGGLVTIEPRRGASVKVPTRAEVEDMLAVREALEGMAARLAAERASDDDVARLRDCVQRLKTGKRKASASKADFHDVLIRAARNEALQELMRGSMNMFRMLRSISSRMEGRSGESGGEHEAILRAIEARDADAAEAQSRSHVRHVRETLLGALDRGSPADAGRARKAGRSRANSAKVVILRRRSA
jgi:DNA-binding GntR family transcriptional regulator